jgi:3-phenylpropionate/trans-cinnamate dioxygenase ferredoxin reductase subunit
VQLALGRRALAIDRANRSLKLDDGRELRYDRLLLTTGSRVRTLDVPGAQLAGVHHLRTIADVDGIAASLRPDARVVLIGAGYIGLEVAAVLAQRGLDVTVLEAAARVMARVVCTEVSDFYQAQHAAAGVKIHFGAVVKALHGAERVEAAEIADGRRFACDLVIAGIGIQPNIELAAAAGLECANGIVVDELARTTDPLILSAGDCANHPHPLLRRRVRLESVQNAIHHAKVAAMSLLGAAAPEFEAPWFWSDQYDLKLQIAGLSEGYDEVVIRGDPGTKSFAAYYLAAGVVVAVDAINSPRDFLGAKKLIAAHAIVSAEVLRNPATDIGALLS